METFIGVIWLIDVKEDPSSLVTDPLPSSLRKTWDMGKDGKLHT